MYVWKFHFAAFVFIIVLKGKIYFANISISSFYINIFIFILFTIKKLYLRE